MKTPLVEIVTPSIYKADGTRLMLPTRMARCTADTKAAIMATAEDLGVRGGRLYLSDLFRSYDMQLGSHLDWKSGKKKAYSPPPGGSLHEAGRAFDLDLAAIKIPLADFWTIASKHGLVPIIAQPKSGASESWHFECRGSHALVYDHYKAGKGTNFAKPYMAMAASAIVSVGVKLDRFGNGQDAAYVQSGLIRLGSDIGNIDGAIGPKTRKGLADRQIAFGAVEEMVAAIDAALEQRFPEEFFDRVPGAAELLPA